jgi:hypothetical protein
LCAAFAEVLEGNDYGRWHYVVELSPTWTPETLAVIGIPVRVRDAASKDRLIAVDGIDSHTLRRELGLPG